MSSATQPEWLTPDYEFVRTLGRGSAGWVALARHRPLDRLVAVKTIYGGHFNPAATARLRREGRALARLNRPTIVRVLEILAHDRGLSLVMQYAPGGDLGRALDTVSVPVPLALTYLVDVADALTASAAAGVVHRDVKAANVLLDGHGRALLGDFGLARFAGATGEFRTVAGTVTGTPLYMAPEQSDPNIEATAAVDAYAFAVLAYRVLTGAHPFQASTLPEIQLAHRTLRPTPPWEIITDFPRRPGRAILAGLEKDPDRRLSPAELVAALTGVPIGRWPRLIPSPGVPRADDPPPAQLTGTASGGRGTEIDDAAAPAEAGAFVAASRMGRDVVEPGSFSEQWVAPPVYVPPPTRDRRHALTMYAVGVGLLVGLVLYLLLRT